MFIPVRSSKYPAMQLLFLNFSSIVLTKMKKKMVQHIKQINVQIIVNVH